MHFTKLILLLLITSQTLKAELEKPTKITIDELTATTHSFEPEADAAILLQDVKVNLVYDTGKDKWVTEVNVLKRIKIYNNNETDRSDFVIKYYDYGGSSERVTGIKGVTYNSINNKIDKTELNKKNIFDEQTTKYYSQKKIAMPDVRAGSIVELRYKLISPLLRIPQRYIQYDIPCNKSIYRVEVPEYFNYNSSTTGSIPIDVDNEESTDRIMYSYTTRTGGYAQQSKINNGSIDYRTKVQTFSNINTPSLKDENHVRNIDNYRASVKFELASYRSPNGGTQQYLKSWDQIAENLNDSNDFGKFLTSKKKELRSIIQEVEELESSAVIQHIYNYVQSNYRWNDYYGVVSESGINNLLKDKRGNVADINLLLVKLLRLSGVNAHPVVGRSSFSGFLNMYYPTTDELNYVLAAVINEDNTITMMDATSKYHYLGSLPERALNLKGIVITSDDLGIPVDIKNPNKGKSVIVAKAHYDMDEGLIVNCKMRKSKYDGLELYLDKASYSSEEEWINDLESAFENREIEQTKIEYADQITKGAVIIQDYIDDVEAEVIGDKIYVSGDLGLAEDSHPYKNKSRELPVFFESAQTKQYSLQFDLPEGYRVESLPEPLSIGLPEKALSYNYKITQNNSQLIIQIMEARRTDIISPSLYPALKEVYDQIIAKQSEKIVLIKAE